MPVVTQVRCCDYHAGPLGERAPVWFQGTDIRSWPREDRDRVGATRQGFIAVPRRLTMLRDVLADAIEHDHDCEDPGCDIAAAMANGYVTAAYHMLTGATEAHACDAIVGALELEHGRDAVLELLGADLYTCPDWPGWKDHHDRYGRPCDACGGYTYAEHGWEPESCAHCGAEYPHPFAGENRSRLPDVMGGYALFAITDDGDTLCETCVTDPTNPVHDVRERPDVWHDGWSVVGFDTTGNVEELPTCAHCGETIGAAPSTYDSPSAQLLRDNLSGQTVWSADRGWHDGAER